MGTVQSRTQETELPCVSHMAEKTPLEKVISRFICLLLQDLLTLIWNKLPASCICASGDLNSSSP